MGPTNQLFFRVTKVCVVRKMRRALQNIWLHFLSLLPLPLRRRLLQIRLLFFVRGGLRSSSRHRSSIPLLSHFPPPPPLSLSLSLSLRSGAHGATLPSPLSPSPCVATLGGAQGTVVHGDVAVLLSRRSTGRRNGRLRPAFTPPWEDDEGSDHLDGGEEDGLSRGRKHSQIEEDGEDQEHGHGLGACLVAMQRVFFIGCHFDNDDRLLACFGVQHDSILLPGLRLAATCTVTSLLQLVKKKRN